MIAPISKLEQGMLDGGIIKPEPVVEVEPMRIILARKGVEAKLRRAAEEMRLEQLGSAQPKAPLFSPAPPRAPESAWVQNTIAWSVGGLLVALLVTAAFVPIERAQNTKVELDKYKAAKTVMVCADGYSVAMNLESVWTWITDGSALVCTDWETPEGRDARAREKSEARAKAALSGR